MRINNMKVVKHYTDAFAANIAKGMLENEGIPAAVLNQNQVFAGLPTDLGTIDLAVEDENYEKALKLIEATSKEE